MKLFAALLALTLSLAGCGPVDGDPIRSGAAASDSASRPDAVTVAQLRQQAEQNGSLAAVLYLGSVPERTADVDAALDSLQEQPWQFVADIPADHRVAAPGGGCDLYCIFPQDPDATLFVYEATLTDDAENPLQRGKQLYYSEDGQPILLLCNISDIAPSTEVELYPSTGEELVFSPFLSGENGHVDGQPILLLCNISDIAPSTEVELYPSTGEELVFSPFLSGENGHVVEAEGVCDFTIYPEGDDWISVADPWSLEGNWLEFARDTDEGFFETAPADADAMCFLPTDTEIEGDQLPLTASYITPYPELNVEEADLFYHEGTPEVPFQTNQEWYATFTGEDGSRYAVTLEDENTLALKFYLEGEESYMSLVSTVYFARQEAMG